MSVSELDGAGGIFLDSCAVRERTADGVSVGRCWYWLKDGKCPRHGDVSKQMAEYAKTGKLFEDPRASAPTPPHQ